MGRLSKKTKIRNVWSPSSIWAGMCVFWASGPTSIDVKLKTGSRHDLQDMFSFWRSSWQSFILFYRWRIPDHFGSNSLYFILFYILQLLFSASDGGLDSDFWIWEMYRDVKRSFNGFSKGTFRKGPHELSKGTHEFVERPALPSRSSWGWWEHKCIRSLLKGHKVPFERSLWKTN